MDFTIEKLIQALQNVAEDSEQGLERPIIFQAITSNEDEFVTLLSLQIAIGDKDFEYLTLKDE